MRRRALAGAVDLEQGEAPVRTQYSRAFAEGSGHVDEVAQRESRTRPASIDAVGNGKC